MKEKLKKQICELDKKLYEFYKFKDLNWRIICPEMFLKLQKLDQKRKLLRIKLKSLYETRR